MELGLAAWMQAHTPQYALLAEWLKEDVKQPYLQKDHPTSWSSEDQQP